MSKPLSRRYAASEAYPGWFADLLGAPLPEEGDAVQAHGRRLVMRRGLLRDEAVDDAGQKHTGDTFGFKWAQRHTYSSPSVESVTRTWLVERYGDLSSPAAWAEFGPEAV